MTKKYQPIGFMDSGVGGISVMREAIRLLPKENLIYYGDSKNAPYGIKSDEEIKNLTFNVVNELLDKGVKAIVVACNTATSVAIKDLRERFSGVPIIGIEPAVKPAVMLHRDGKIIVMATPVTLKREKFNHLLEKYNEDNDLISLPCPELVEFVERGITEGKELHDYLFNRFQPYLKDRVSAVVLGCTHFPFVSKEIKKIMKDAAVIDGSTGTVKNLKHILEEKDLLNDSKEDGKIEILNSLENKDMIRISERLLFTERYVAADVND